MSAHHPFERSIEVRGGMVHHAFLACPEKTNRIIGGHRDPYRAPTATVITCLWCMTKWLRGTPWAYQG